MCSKTIPGKLNWTTINHSNGKLWSQNIDFVYLVWLEDFILLAPSVKLDAEKYVNVAN